MKCYRGTAVGMHACGLRRKDDLDNGSLLRTNNIHNYLKETKTEPT